MGEMILLVVLFFLLPFFIFMAVKSTKASINAENVIVLLIEGMETYSQNSTFVIKRCSEGLNFMQKEKILNFISYKDIESIEVNKEIKQTEKDKTVVGRALLGGILLGPVGAIVGGMSGIGTKKKIQEDFYLVINLKENNPIVFKQPPLFNNVILLDNFARKTQELILAIS